MTEFTVAVTLRHKATHREVRATVSVAVDGDQPNAATLLAAQVATAHRDGWSPIATEILSAVL